MTALLMPTRAPLLLPDDDSTGAPSGPGILGVIAALLDGTPGAAESLAPARALAARLDADLVVIQADAPTEQLHGGLGADAAHPASMDRRPRGPADRLDEAVATARAQGLRAHGLRVAAPKGRTTDPAAALLTAAQESGAGLLVLSAATVTSEAGETLAAHAPLPLLCVPPHYGARADDGALRWLGWEQAALQATRAGHALAPMRLLVALDGAPAAERALPLVCGLAHSLAAQVSLVRVVPSSSALYCAGTTAVAAVEAGLGYLQRTATQLQHAGLAPHHIRTAVRLGDPAHELLAQAAREQTTILVTARRTMAGPTRPLHHSVTAHLLQHAPLPVLVVPAA